jgi:hypothetical protein
VIGGDWGKADWAATHDTGAVSPRRTHCVDITSLSAASLEQLVNQINNSVADYLSGSVNRLAAYPDTTLQTLNTSGIAGIFSSTPA